MNYCPNCGGAVSGGAYCPHCGRSLAPDAAAEAPPPAPVHVLVRPERPVSMGVAVVALVLNVLLWPGLGSLVAGEKVGWAQGFLHLLGWFVAVGTLFIGFFLYVPIWTIAWVWGLVTGIQLVTRAGRQEPQSETVFVPRGP